MSLPRNCTLLLIAVLMALLFNSASAIIIFSEDFESKESLNQWNANTGDSITSWASVDSQHAFEGNGGLRILTGEGRFLEKSIHWPIHSPQFEKGIYCQFWFRIILADTAAITQGNPYVRIAQFLLAPVSGNHFHTPVLLFQKHADGRIYLQTLQRPAFDSSAKTIGVKDNVPLEALRWYHAALFMAFRSDSIIDSLFIDTMFVGCGTMKLSSQPMFLKSWAFGIAQASQLPLTAMDVDNIVISEQRFIPILRTPGFVSPVPFCYLEEHRPEFMISAVPGTRIRWCEIRVDSAGKIVRDSVFAVGGPFTFARPFPQGAEYRYAGRFIDAPESRGPWSKKRLFFTGKSSSSLMFSRLSSSDQMALTMPAGPGNRIRSGDTLVLLFTFPPCKKEAYIDLNLCSESFTSEKQDRFGVFDESSNYVYSISSGDSVFYKCQQGKNRTTVAVAGDQSLPMQVLLLDKVIFCPESGSAQVSIHTISKMLPGVWAIHANMVCQDTSALSRFSSLYFLLSNPPLSMFFRRILPLLAVLTLACVLIAIFWVWRRKKPGEQQIPEQWRKIADQIDACIAEKYSDANMDREQLVRHVFLSERRASDIYQEVRGISIVQRLREYRIQKASELLKLTGKSISEIAYEVGFSDPIIFLRNFKKITGKTPKDYRRG